MYPPSSRSSHRSKSVAEPPSYETVDSPRPRSKNLPPPPTHQERTHAPSSRQSERSHAPSSRSSQTPPLGHHARHRSEVPPSKDVRRDRDRDGKRDSERESRKFVDGLEEELTCPICMGVMVGPHQLSPCGHALCGPCGVSWLESRASSGNAVNCPTCREGVSPNQPLIPARNLETMIQKWIEARGGRWQDLDEWKDREETWNIHKQFNPTLVSPELFPHRSRSGTRHRRSGSNDHVRGDLFGGFFGMDMPSARNYFDDGPRVASGGGGAARGNGQGWVEQGYEDLPFPDMFHRSRPSGHLLVREFVFPRPLGGFHSRMTNILGETPLGVEAPFRSYDGVMDVMQDMFRRFGIPVPDRRR